MFNLGMGEILVILVIALIVLGPSQLPKVATSIGKAMREFRKATSDIRDEIDKDEVIARPLRELRDAMTLPPDELKRQDEWRRAEEARQKTLAAAEGTVPTGALAAPETAETPATETTEGAPSAAAPVGAAAPLPSETLTAPAFPPGAGKPASTT